MIDITRKLQDKANEIVNEALSRVPDYEGIPEINDFLKGLVALSLQKGFIYGVTSIKQTTECLLEQFKGEGKYVN